MQSRSCSGAPKQGCCRTQPALPLHPPPARFLRLAPAAEIMKRRIAGLHQNTAISSVELTDKWEPKVGAGCFVLVGVWLVHLNRTGGSSVELAGRCKPEPAAEGWLSSTRCAGLPGLPVCRTWHQRLSRLTFTLCQLLVLQEEGLDPIETTRHVSVITITLSKVRAGCCATCKQSRRLPPPVLCACRPSSAAMRCLPCSLLCRLLALLCCWAGPAGQLDTCRCGPCCCPLMCYWSTAGGSGLSVLLQDPIGHPRCMPLSPVLLPASSQLLPLPYPLLQDPLDTSAPGYQPPLPESEVRIVAAKPFAGCIRNNELAHARLSVAAACVCCLLPDSKVWGGLRPLCASAHCGRRKGTALQPTSSLPRLAICTH